MASEQQFLYLIICSLGLNVLVIKGNFTKYLNSGNDNVLFTDAIAFTNSAVNKVECATSCSQQEGCGVFTFDMELKLCRGHAVVCVDALQQYVKTGYSRTYSIHGKYSNYSFNASCDLRIEYLHLHEIVKG